MDKRRGHCARNVIRKIEYWLIEKRLAKTSLFAGVDLECKITHRLMTDLMIQKEQK